MNYIRKTLREEDGYSAEQYANQKYAAGSWGAGTCKGKWSRMLTLCCKNKNPILAATPLHIFPKRLLGYKHRAHKEHFYTSSFTALTTALAEASQDISSLPNLKEE